PAFVRYLREAYAGQELHTLEKDILKTDLEKDLKIAGPIKVFGNIPYNITSPILEWLIENRALVSDAVLTVQWEVAERLAARPKTKAWGALSLFVQVYAGIELVKRIPRGAFYPAPKVDSATVRLSLGKNPRYALKSEDAFFCLVRRAFQKRRKTILNALTDKNSLAMNREFVFDVLRKSGTDPGRRPETLSIEEWVRLADTFHGEYRPVC
ncbi:MAG TPA: 16S rRNA (adenine(1518)-N(6)/adenine(1519)-N(6))-dimethyltransferase RsmA, partial [Candidatus Omnitrophota bacterium]|nr:16S rRNA (adenine(1518)-N(6)/adenine(1519)-N(6))-dimethyltransferase RsmA [Candidatus Omnitrophota bacterium]